MYHGDIALGDTIDIKFTTRQFSTGAPFALASGAVAAYPGNSTTQITTGITLTASFDSGDITTNGLNNVRVVASSGNGYATATNYTLVITAGTVDSVSVIGEVVGSFSIENRSGLRPTTAGRTLDVSATGEAGIDWANIGSPTTAQNLSATNIDTDQVVASVTGAVGSVTGAVGSVTGAVGSVTGAVGSVTGNVGGTIGGLTAAALADFFDTNSGTTYGAAIAGSVVKEIADNAGGGTPPTAAEIADAVWDEDATAHQTGGTFGQAIGDPGADTTTIYQSVVTDAAGTNVAADIIAVKADTAAILLDTAEIGAAGAGLTNINLPDQTMNITGDITGNLSGSVGSVTGLTAANLDATISSRATPAQVNAEVVDALATDTYAEPGQGAPAATTTLAAKINYLFKAWRNRVTQDSTTYKLYADNTTTVDQKATVSDDTTTFDKGEIGSGP